MDRTTYEQLDRIEGNVETLLEIYGDEDKIKETSLLEFRDNEILSSKGNLQHLAKDKTLMRFFEAVEDRLLRKERNDGNNDDTEYSTKKLT